MGFGPCIIMPHSVYRADSRSVYPFSGVLCGVCGGCVCAVCVYYTSDKSDVCLIRYKMDFFKVRVIAVRIYCTFGLYHFINNFVVREKSNFDFLSIIN